MQLNFEFVRPKKNWVLGLVLGLGLGFGFGSDQNQKHTEAQAKMSESLGESPW